MFSCWLKLVLFPAFWFGLEFFSAGCGYLPPNLEHTTHTVQLYLDVAAWSVTTVYCQLPLSLSTLADNCQTKCKTTWKLFLQKYIILRWPKNRAYLLVSETVFTFSLASLHSILSRPFETARILLVYQQLLYRLNDPLCIATEYVIMTSVVISTRT